MAVAAAGLVAGCATNFGGMTNGVTSALGEQAPPLADGKPQKPVRIGMLLSLSGYGPQTITAKGMKQAGELALFELDNPLVQLIVKDDKGSPQGAAQAAQEAIGEGAEIIVGPMTGAAASAVAPVARRSGVPVLTFSNDRRVAGDGVYLMSVLPEQEIERIVAYAAGKGKRRFAALVPADGYGQVVEPAFREAVARHGGAVGAVTSYPLEPNAMLAPVRALADEVKLTADSTAPIDALLIAAGPEMLPQIDPILTYAGISSDRIQLLGTGGWDFAGAGRSPAFVRGWYPGPDPHGWADFAQRFSRSFGQGPPRLASLAYDAVSIAITLSSAEPGQRFTAAALTRPTGFTGVDGSLRFRPDGLSERGLAVLELQTFGGNVLDPAQPVAPPDGRVSTR
ncbi:penicillin-binding protein activator [Hyphomicrobium sp.]|uniref:penicillin-binding protein activator n=1 Tax=Hyphomicrobium sp. TaxID=82 RepID=UPI0025BDED90|nr:penicillin-binding protein activator [Hyphomicrobium sp.]MCC7250422.1 penicillin-binding protein activator [Hyphomicrobium sp.]